jgi:RNA-directed DNA polymerase
MRVVRGLWPQIAAFLPLVRAARRAAKPSRGEVQTLAFLVDLEANVLELERELLGGTYRPAPYQTFTISDPKPRTISAAAFRDRVVHHALCAALDAMFERSAVFDSFACRRGKGTLRALWRAQSHARRFPRFLKLDVRHFFETADHGVLMDRFERCLRDPPTLVLIRTFVEAGAPGSPPGRGLPIGNLTSQYFANFYLDALDRFAQQTLRVPGYVRYMDDILVFGDERAQLADWHGRLDAFVRDTLKLELKSEVTRLSTVEAGVPFLGFRVWPGLIRFDAVRARRFRRRIRLIEAERRRGACDEDSALRRIESLVGWARHGDTRAFRASFFTKLAKSGED